MKEFLLLLYAACTFSAVSAQRNFAEAIQQGDTAFSKGEFKTAINKYFAAEAFDPSKKEQVKQKVNRVFDYVQALKEQAEVTRNGALMDKMEAEKARQEQIRQTSISMEEQRKLRSLNDFMKYNNEQLFNEISRNKADMLDLKAREYNLLNKYNDSSYDDRYRFYSMFQISEYYERNKDLENAFKWADALCSQYPDSSLAFMRRMVVNYYSANWQKALQDIDSCLLLNRDEYYTPVLQWNKGLILCNLGRHDDAGQFINGAFRLLQKMPSEEVWSDDFVVPDIIKATSIYSIYMDRDYQLKTVETYALVNKLYTGTASIESLSAFKKKQLPLSVLLSIINFTTIHMGAIPDEYIGYLINGYCWELANYPDQASINYKLFLQQHNKLKVARYNQYRNNFNSPLYNKFKN